MTPLRYARVALPLPVAEPYRYLIPAGMLDRAVPGARTVVPLKRGELIGIIVAVDDEPPPGGGQARELLAIPHEPVALEPHLLALAHELARYCGAPLGLTLRSMLPGPLWGRATVLIRKNGAGRHGELGGTAGRLLDWLGDHGGEATVAAASRALRMPVWPAVDRLQRIGAVSIESVAPSLRAGKRSNRMAVIAGESLTLIERNERFSRAPAQRALYETLEQVGGRLEVATLLARAATSSGPLRAMVASGVVRIDLVEAPRDPFAAIAGTPPPESLTAAQQVALDQLAGLAPGEDTLLFGVTGSGKTAVYLARLRQILDSGRGAILLVPEIALTPQTVSRVRGAFGDEVAVLHSALSDNERADAWRSLRRGERRVAVGARSAVFAPVANLGVIVLDEEHEATYKNSETPRYHARDVARRRARLEGATVILGSATPSLESWAGSASSGRRSVLPKRISDRPLPPVELVDLRCAEMPQPGAVPWSTRLDDAVRDTLGRDEQVLLLLNRRGWATYVQCRQCGTVVECPACSISMTVHRRPEQLRCHYCDHRCPVPQHCSQCGADTVRQRGAGTQQLEQLVAERFPEARLARMDVDSTGGRWSHHRILDRVGNGEVDILLGTQMIAKGIDFPNVTLVGVVDSDTALHLPDFRASERTFQLIAQVAGRTGRGSRGGVVLVQTRQPEHPALQFAAAHDAEGFLGAELINRRQPPYPPTVALARVVASGTDRRRVDAAIAGLAEWSVGAIAASDSDLVVLGPAPCPIERIKGAWRSHLLVRGDENGLGAWVRTVGPRLGALRHGVRFTLDRDPVSLL